jgi:hypothetical protein
MKQDALVAHITASLLEARARDGAGDLQQLLESIFRRYRSTTEAA